MNPSIQKPIQNRAKKPSEYLTENNFEKSRSGSVLDFLKCSGGATQDFELQTTHRPHKPSNENFEVGVSEKEMLIMTQTLK